MRTINAKLGNMRKVVEWVVYPRSAATDPVQIQSDHRICRFGLDGKGLLSKHVANYPNSLMLYPTFGATVVEVPQDVIAAALEAAPKAGEEIGPGVYVAAGM